MIHPNHPSADSNALFSSRSSEGFSRAGMIGLVAAVLLLGSTVFLFTQNRALQEEVRTLRADAQEVQQLRETQNELQTLRNQAAELDRLRKDSQELLRLRNEARQFREQQQQLEKITAENAQLRANAQQLQQRAQQAEVQTREIQARQQLVETTTPFTPPVPPAPPGPEVRGCLKNLRQLHGATEQWALETRKTPGTPVTWNDIAPYFSAVPVCPAGGSYSLTPVGQLPQCSIPGHQLPQASP
jgi:hypothetical protein